MIKNFLKHISYICPVCSEINETDINIFELLDTEFICADSLCNEECVSITRTGEKLKIQINCPVCGNVHNFKISSSTFILKELFTLSCPESGIKIFFSGDEQKVSLAVKDNNENISKMASIINQNSDDLELFYEIVDLLYEYLKNKKVFCSCGSTRIIPDADNHDIILTCEDCGREITLLPTEDTLEYLLNTGFIKL